MEVHNRFINAKELSEILSLSTSMAYKIISQLNKELHDAGYLTVAGRVPRAYFEKRFYSGSIR